MRVLEREVHDERGVGAGDEHRVRVGGVGNRRRLEGRAAHRDRHGDEVTRADDVDDDVVGPVPVVVGVELPRVG